MTGYYVKMSETECTGLVSLARVRGPAGVDDELSVLIADEDRCIDIDKAWHGIHAMLCGLEEGADTDIVDSIDDSMDENSIGAVRDDKPLFDAVLGGTPLNGVEMAYLPVRWLGRQEVADTAGAISGIDLLTRTDDFRERVLDNAEIYPGLVEEDDINYLDYNFEQLKRFFREAAENRLCMLLFID